MAALWFRRRELWCPTWRIVLVAVLAITLAGGGCFLTVHDWLSPTAPINDARYAVVEGWAPDPVPWAAKQWTGQHETLRVYTTGIPLDKGMMISPEINYADITASTLRRMGVDATKVQSVPATSVNTDRTRAMARALKTALDAGNVPAEHRRINLFTNGTHGRRSWMHFKNELGPEWQVGIISVPSAGYPASSWWRYSEGVKAVLTELIAIVVQALGGR